MTTPIILKDRGLRAFHNDPAVQAKYLARVDAHRAADEIVQGVYVEKYGESAEKLRGCAVGCTIHSGKHADYETEIGVPRWLAYLEDRLFEMMPVENAVEWPGRFLRAIPLGADLSKVYPKFVGWMLTNPEHGCLARLRKRNAGETICALVQEVADRYIDGSMTRERGRELADAIYAERSKLWAIWREKRKAADLAWSRSAAAAAAAAAAEAAAAAAEAAEAAAEAAAAAAEAAEAAAAAWYLGRSRYALAASEQLLVLLAEAPVPVAA